MKWYAKQMKALLAAQEPTTPTPETAEKTASKAGHSFDNTKLRGRDFKHNKPGEKRSRPKTDLP